MTPSFFDDYLARWNLVPDGAPIQTHSSRLLPVRRDGMPAIIKAAVEAEEQRGGILMEWYAGDGAARVYERHGHVLLLERAMGARSLAHMARHGEDDEASRVICAVAGRLHASRGGMPDGLIPLEDWFRDLWPGAGRYGGVIEKSAGVARNLLDAPQDIVPLHGDLHHENVLDFDERGWLAIDPKRLVGERGFDFANIFCNPDLKIAAAPGRLARQSCVVAQAAGLDRTRLLQWILAYAGLSAVWIMDDPRPADKPDIALAVAESAAAELGI